MQPLCAVDWLMYDWPMRGNALESSDTLITPLVYFTFQEPDCGTILGWSNILLSAHQFCSFKKGLQNLKHNTSKFRNNYFAFKLTFLCSPIWSLFISIAFHSTLVKFSGMLSFSESKRLRISFRSNNLFSIKNSEFHRLSTHWIQPAWVSNVHVLLFL